MDHNCIFCKIVGREVPSSVVYEDDSFFGIMDISPANKGHVILLSKNHIADVFSLDGETARKAMTAVSKIATAMRHILKCDGINVLQNNGEAAGQTVFHYHIHVIPRYKEDGVTIAWNSKPYNEGEMKELGDAYLSFFSDQGERG